MRFLIVDDSLTMRKIIRHFLERLGHTDCIGATNGLDALSRFEATVSPVITDWNMPEMSGIDFTRDGRAYHHGDDEQRAKTFFLPSMRASPTS